MNDHCVSFHFVLLTLALVLPRAMAILLSLFYELCIPLPTAILQFSHEVEVLDSSLLLDHHLDEYVEEKQYYLVLKKFKIKLNEEIFLSYAWDQNKLTLNSKIHGPINVSIICN